MQIKTLRKIVQVIFFIMIIYGGYITATIFDIKVVQPAMGTEADVELSEISLPVRSCRYIQPKPTLFESCSVRYLLNFPLYSPSWPSVALALMILAILYVIFSRFMCGWFCPLGFFSDMLNYLREKLKLDRITLPENVRNFLKLWRYSFFIFLICISVALVLPFAYKIFMDKNFYEVACQVCPARTIIPLFGGQLPTTPSFFTAATAVFSTLSLIFLGIYISGLFVTRSWCRVCPNGTLSGLFSKGALLVKEKDVRKCTRCGICKRVCPFENNHVFEEKQKRNVNHPNCIMCFTCVEKCPEKDCLHITLMGKKIYSSKMRPMSKDEKYE
jgi:ferredoxin-type protein NapH